MAIRQDDTGLGQPAIDFEALGVKPVSDEELYGIAPTPEFEEPTEKAGIDFEALGVKPVSDEELYGVSMEPMAELPQESFLRPVADPFLNIGAGINDVVKGFTDAFGADNAVSQNLAKNSDWYRSLLSASAKQDQEEIGRIMQEAEGQGVLAEIGAGLKALSVAPVDLVAQGIGSLIPFIATAGVGKAVGLSKAGIAVLQGVQGGAVGGGIVKGEIYNAVKEQLLASGVDEANAEKAANEAQAYNGKNLDQILLGVGLGVAASSTGAEGAIRGLIARKVGKEAAEQVSEQAIQQVLRTGFIRGATKDGIVETATEALQGGQERLAANIAVSREGFEVEPMRGVFGQATLEGALGGVLGGVAGGISAKAEQIGMRESVALRDAAKAAQEAKQNNAPASAAAVEEQINQALEETPEQKKARLEEEAAAAAGIELEEGPEIGVEPTVPVTPPTEPTPEGAVAPVEPVVTPEVAEPQPAAEVAPTESVAPTPTEQPPVAERPVVAPETLNPRGRQAVKVLTSIGVDEDTASYVASRYQDEAGEMGAEEWREFILKNFQDNGGVIPAVTRYSEDQRYYELAFGVGPEEAAQMVENAKYQNQQMAQNELQQNKQWRRKDEQQITEAERGVVTPPIAPEGAAIPAGGVPPSPAIEGGGIPVPAAAPTEVAAKPKPPQLPPNPKFAPLPEPQTYAVLREAREERAKAPIDKARGLEPKKIIGRTAREVLRYASRLNQPAVVGPSDKGFTIYDIAALLAEVNSPLLDKEKVESLGSLGSRGRAARFRYAAAIGVPSTRSTSVETLVHEVAHTLTNDAIDRYSQRTRGKSGKVYIDSLKNAIADKNTPEPVVKLFNLYISTLEQLGIMDAYGKAGGLAGTMHPDMSRKRAIKMQKSGKLRTDLGWSELYGLANVDEFVAQTFSSEKFRNLLKTLQASTENKSVWESFVSAIRYLLNLPNDTMASAVIETSISIAETVPEIERQRILQTTQDDLDGFNDGLELKLYLENNPSKDMTDAKDDFKKRFNRDPHQFAGQHARFSTKEDIEKEIRRLRDRLLEYQQLTPSPAPEAEAVSPNLEPLRRVARAEQTPEDVPSLVEAGLVEVYKDQPVITDAGLAALPEAERPRLTPEARKIQIDTGSNEVVAEAISKNLRIGVDQVGANVRMPAGWTLVEDIYVPPAAPEVRESRREPAPLTQQDREYLDAVERGDLGAAQRIVDEAADRAGYNIGPMWHGTDSGEFTSFKREGFSLFFFSPDKEYAQKYGKRLIKAYLKGNRIGRTNQELTALESTTQGRVELWSKFRGDNAIDVLISSPEIGNREIVVSSPNQIKSGEVITRDDQGNIIPPSQRFQPTEEDIRYKRIEMPRPVGMEPEAVTTKLESLGFGRGGIVSVVNQPDASFEGRTIIRDGRVVGIELNAAALRDDGAVERVLNHEIAESANADGALNRLVAGLTPKERKEINDAITRLGYAERARTAEEAARAVELLAEGWRGRRWFERAVARIEAWANKLGYKLTRRAAEYIAARNVSEINAEFKQAYNKFINVQGEAREGRAFVTPAENARFLELAKNPEANREELQKMVDAAATRAGYRVKAYHGTTAPEFNEFKFSERPVPYVWGNVEEELKTRGSSSPFNQFFVIRIEKTKDGKYIVKTVYNKNPASNKVFETAQEAIDAIEAGREDKKLTDRPAFFFATNRLYAEMFSGQSGTGAKAKDTGVSRVMPVALRTDRIFDFRDKQTREWLQNWISKNREYIERESRNWNIDFSKNAAIQNLKKGNWGIFEAFPKLTEDLKAEGYTGYTTIEGGNLIWKGQEWKDYFKRAEKFFGRGGRDASLNYALFNPSDVKSSEAVTYDDQGNVIPLSERFQPTTPDIRYSIRESRREDAIPTFSEGSPEASTLSTMASSMAKVDAASEAKPNPENKPTYKISEIASVWMDQGGDTRQLQDMIEENTLLSPANAKKVANAIAKQYDIQQSIAEAQVETAEGVSLEGLPEGVSIPKEADPKRPKTVIQRLIDVTTGVRVPPVKITATERSLLNNQIRMRAAANREAKKAQQETANEVVEMIKAMELRGPVRPKQAQALAKRAAKVIWTSEKSMESFMAYAEKVVANTNYDADLREAKAAQKRALELSKRSNVASPQQEILANVAKIGVNMLDNPREFAEVVNYYMRGFKPVISPDYLVVPDDEMTSYLSQAEDIVEEAKIAFDRVVTQRLSEKYGVSPDRIQEILDAQDIERALVQYAKREVAESILNEKVNEVLAGLKAYDQTGLRSDQRKIIDSILKLDPSLLSSQEKQQFVRTGNNIIFNNQTHGAELFAVTAKGQQMAKEAASNEDLIAKNTAWVNILPSLRSRTLQKTWRNWALELQSVADTFRNAFGKGAMAKVYRMMGMYELDRGFTAAANTVNQIQEEIAAFYNNLEKKYKAAARNQDGILAEGIVGFLIQKVPEKGEIESLAQRRNLIQQDIRNRRISQDADRIEMANRIERILQQLDGESVNDIMANLKRDYRANYESVTWLKDTLFPKYKEFLKRFDENFNDQANNYDNPDYLPIGFIRAGVSLAITPENEAMYYEHVSLRPKQSSYTIKRADYIELPTDKTTNKPKEIEFNLRRNAFDSLSDQINKAYTSPAWQQIFAFMKTPESEKLFGGAANKEFFIERLNRLRLSRMRRGSMSTGYIEKTADVLSVFARKIGTGIALGGAYQPFKQAPDQIIAAIGTTGRADLMAENMAPVNLKAAKVVLDKFSIGRRGDASSGYKYINQMEGAQNKIERYLSESRWDAAKEQAGKIADVWLLALKKTDYVFAAGAWMTYYRAQLAKDGVAFQGWDKEAELLETDTARQDAASYAEQMTDIYQGSSDPTKMATFVQSGKSGWENLFKAIFVPFNSFAVQQRMRIYSDARDVFTKSGDRAAGGIGLAATVGGLLAFHSVRRFALPALTGLGVSMLYAAFGVDMDEPDEEKKAEDFAKRWRQFLGEFTANLLVGGSGQIVEAATIDSFNYASYLIAMQTEDETVLGDDGEIISFSKYAKERSPFWRYRSFDNAMSLGMFDIGLDQGKKAILESKTLMTPEEMENFTNEEQSLLYFAALSDWLYLMRLNDADFSRMVDRARREIKARSKETEKELNRIRAGR